MLYFKVQGLPRINTVALQKSSLESLKTSGVNVAMPKIHSTAGRFCSVASIPRYHHTFERRPVLCTSSQNAVQSCQTATKSSCNMRERHCKTDLLILKVIGASNLVFHCHGQNRIFPSCCSQYYHKDWHCEVLNAKRWLLPPKVSWCEHMRRT